MGERIFRIWYRVGHREMDFAECSAKSEQEAREWFYSRFNETIVDIEETSFYLLEG